MVGMTAGTLFRPLGSLGETRVADWVDLLTPFAIVGAAAATLARLACCSRWWAVFGAGAVAFALGHGLHLSANSISNADDPVLKEADIVHLWDEVVSHYVWYLGLFVMSAVLAVALRSSPSRFGPVAVAIAAGFTTVLVTTYIEGGVPWVGTAFLASAVAAGWAWRPGPTSRLLLMIGGLALLWGWGIAWYIADGSIFPELSDVGWI
jgi:hypothetical protein